MKILFQETKLFLSQDYDLFKFFDFNREADQNHVNRLVESIKRWGFVSCVTVIKTDAIDGVMSYYILDGQHRFLAAKILNIH